MALRKRGKWYYVDITNRFLPGGRVRFSTRPANKEQALRIHKEVADQILDLKYDVDGLTPFVPLSWDEFIPKFLEERKHELSDSTLSIYHYSFEWFGRFLKSQGKADLPLNFIRRDDIRRFKFWCIDKDGGLAKTTYNIYHRSLRAAFSWAKKELRAVRVNPFSDVKLYTTGVEYRRDATPADLVKILPGINDELYRDFVLFLFISGLRRGEALNMAWEDIDFDRRFFVVKAASAKHKKFRVLPMSDLHYKILKKRQHLERPFDYDPRLATQRFARAAAKAKIPDISLHSLRHGTTTQLFEREEHPLKIKNLLGHSRLETTMIYTHTQPGYIRSSIEVMGNVGESILKEIGESNETSE